MTPDERAEVAASVRWLMRQSAEFEDLMREMAETAFKIYDIGVKAQAAINKRLAEHPDLVEVNVRLDALYEPPGRP